MINSNISYTGNSIPMNWINSNKTERAYGFKATYTKSEAGFFDNIPNKKTRKALDATKKGKGLVYNKDVDDFFSKLGI